LTATIILHLSTMSNNIGRDCRTGGRTTCARGVRTRLCLCKHWPLWHCPLTAASRDGTTSGQRRGNSFRQSAPVVTPLPPPAANEPSGVGDDPRPWCTDVPCCRHRKSLSQFHRCSRQRQLRTAVRRSRFPLVVSVQRPEALCYPLVSGLQPDSAHHSVVLVLMMLSTRPAPQRLNFAPLRYCAGRGRSRA